MTTLSKLCFAILCFTLASCASSVERSVVTPEKLLNTSSEVVSFPVQNKSSVDTIRAWVQDDAPDSAKLSCPNRLDVCKDVFAVFDQQNIPVEESFENEDKVSLIYSRVTARNCPPHQFGCSISVNTVQMISDFNQFTSPALSSPADAATAVDKYNLYRSGL